LFRYVNRTWARNPDLSYSQTVRETKFNQQQCGYRTGPAQTAPAMDQYVISLFDHLVQTAE